MNPIKTYGCTLLTVLAMMFLSSNLIAADSIYWGNEGAGNIRVANLDGSGVALTLFGSEGAPCGVAIDPAAGKIYWTNFSSGGVRVGNLDGSGTASSLFNDSGSLCGVSIDPVGGKIYWANFSNNTIRVGNLDGSGTAATLFQEASGAAPSGVVIDTDAGLIYWTNQFSDEVRVGNLDGSGTASTLISGEDNPIGVAIDPPTNKIYWTALNAGTVRGADLSDGGNIYSLFTGEGSPGGLAIDPEEDQVYWANFFPGVIRFGDSLDGVGTAVNLFSGESLPLFPVLLKAPVSDNPPSVSSGPGAGELTCETGDWAPDLTGAFLFRAAKDFAFQWFNNGAEISGADEETFTPSVAGKYSCEVTASNQAGETSETSNETNQCQFTPGLTCNDNNQCTTSDTCTGGSCTGTTITCPNDAFSCTTAVCEPQSGCGQKPNHNFCMTLLNSKAAKCQPSKKGHNAVTGCVPK